MQCIVINTSLLNDQFHYNLCIKIIYILPKTYKFFIHTVGYITHEPTGSKNKDFAHETNIYLLFFEWPF